MPSYAIARIEKRKMSAVGRIEKHHEREKEKYKSNPDIDPQRSHLNFHLVRPAAGYRALVQERIRQAGARVRRDSVVLQDGLVAASPEWLNGKTDAEKAEYFRYAYAFFEQRYGAENMISALVHLDEATPHLHFCFVPITPEGRLSSKTVMGGPAGMRKLQNDFYEYMSRRYPELSRGTPKEVSHRTHLPGYLFKNAAELYKHYGEICAAIQDIGMIGNSRKKDEAIALLGRYAPEMAAIRKDVARTDKHIRSLERALSDSRQENHALQAANSEQQEQLQEEKRKVLALSAQQQKLQAQLRLIPPDLMEELVRKEKQRRRQKHMER